MKTYMRKSRFGFTLIELLIVIALLGALAVGLLAALDPFEQLKKGTDTGVRNTVSELHGAIIRYYGIKNQMPWCEDSSCTTFSDAAVTAEDIAAPVDADDLDGMITNISDVGELKTNFSQLAGDTTLAKIKIIGTNATATIKVCYKPTANSFINDNNTKFQTSDLAEAPAGTCKGQGGADATCLWCVQ